MTKCSDQHLLTPGNISFGSVGRAVKLRFRNNCNHVTKCRALVMPKNGSLLAHIGQSGLDIGHMQHTTGVSGVFLPTGNTPDVQEEEDSSDSLALISIQHSYSDISAYQEWSDIYVGMPKRVQSNCIPCGGVHRPTHSL